MSAGAILEQFSNLVKHMESIGPKLSSNIRPNKGQLDEIQTLSTKLEAATANIRIHVRDLLQRAAQRAAPNAKEQELLKRLQSSKPVGQLSPPLAIMLRKNLRLIFLGPDVSVLDTKEVRSRREKTRARCERLRALEPPLILTWAITFLPSAWNHPTVMAEYTFNLLIEELKTEEFGQIPPKLSDSLQTLKEEEPLKNSRPFQEFVDKAAGNQKLDAVAPPQMMMTKQQDVVVPSKRQHTAEILASKGNSNEYDADDRQEKIKLIKRSKDIDYKGSSMPVNSLPHFIDRLSTAMESSKQWKWERQLFEDNVMRLGDVDIDRIDCLNVFVPKDRSHDISVTLMVGYEAGLDLIDEMDMEIIRV